MGVGIALSKDSVWLPAAWCSRAVIRYTMPQLQGEAAGGTKKRLEEMGDYMGAIAFFEDAGPAEVKALLAAAERGVVQAKAEGPETWGEPEFFPGFLRAYEELVEYIRLDPRLAGQPAAELAPLPGRSFRYTLFKKQEDRPA